MITSIYNVNYTYPGVKLLKKIVIFYLTYYLIFYSISIIYNINYFYNLLGFIKLPKFFRIIEIVFVFSMFYISISFEKLTKNLNYLFFYTFITLQLFMIMISNFFLIPYKLLSLFSSYGPIILFFILIRLNIEKQDVEKIINFYFHYLIINVIIAFIVLPINNFYYGDGFTGLYPDAHYLGDYLFITSSCLMVLYYTNFNKKYLLYSILFFVISFFPSNEKIILLNMVIFYYLIYKNSKNKLLLILSTVVFSILLFVILNFLGSILDLRLLKITKIIKFEEVGFILAWPLLFSKLNSFVDFLIGIGAATYAGPGAQQLFAAGYPVLLSDVFEFQFNNVYFNSAFQILWNRFTILIAEYGLIGLFVYIVMYIYFINIVKKSNINIKYKSIFYFVLLAMFIQDFINDSGLKQLIIFPAMVIPALAYKNIKGYDYDTNSNNK